MIHQKQVEIKAELWEPDPALGEFIDGEYINHGRGYDAFDVEYTICDVGFHTKRGFIHIKPKEWIVEYPDGQKYVFDEETFTQLFDIK